MSALSVLSIRVPPGETAWLLAHGKKPSEVAKSAFEREVMRLRIEAKFEWLKAHRPKATRPVVDLIREMRDQE